MAPGSDDLTALARDVLEALRRRSWHVTTAESCTGGLIAATLTEIAGSSDVVDRGYVTYSNEAKIELLGVSADLIDRFGAVSAEVAEAMVVGALARSRSDLAVSVTGIAGPGGGTETKPVGLVFIGAAARGTAPVVERHVFGGDRAGVRWASVAAALRALQAAATPT